MPSDYIWQRKSTPDSANPAIDVSVSRRTSVKIGVLQIYGCAEDNKINCHFVEIGRAHV